MITSRRDYLMRILEEVSRLLARISFKRKKGDTDDAALETIVFGFQRLFNLDADQIFLLTPAQHYDLLADSETPEFARDRLLAYAALSAEAGYVYTRQNNPAMARATLTNALQFTLKALANYPTDGLPDYAPKVDDLLTALSAEPLDATTAKLVREHVDRNGHGSSYSTS
jgi:hypothetical protein